jgi:O-antigen/teichoic acid export membrane protein
LLLSIRYWLARGKWSLAAGQITWLQSQSYIYLIVAFLGLHALATVAAARLLFAPLTTGVAAWTKIMLPRLSAGTTGRSMVRQLSVWSLLLIAVLGVWSAALVLGSGWIDERVFEGKYHDVQGVLICWAVVMCATFLRSVWQTGLRACNRFDSVFRISSVGAILSLVVISLGAQHFRVYGALLGLGLAELATSLLCMRTVAYHSVEKS